MQTQTKSWKKPVLIVIGRGTPEERVLNTCKGTSTGGVGKIDACPVNNNSCKHPQNS